MRTLRLKSKLPFSTEAFDAFCASTELLAAYASKLLEVSNRLPACLGMEDLNYVFGLPYLLEDRHIAAVDVHGEWSHISRHLIEEECAIFLWRWLPYEYIDGLEYGRTVLGDTHWSPIHSGVIHAHLDPVERKKLARAVGG